MPRSYTVSFENVAVSAAQDLLQIKGATGKILRILEVWVGATDTTSPTNQQLRIRQRFLPATVTDGSGGSTATPEPVDPGDAAASFTCKTNNTTQATTSGTPVVLRTDGPNILAGYDYTWPRPPIVGPSESFTFELLSTVSGTVHLSGGALVEELGG
jgi:hypothetical protein